MDVSIIIPTYNGGEVLRKTLKSIYAQETNKLFEVITIDSGSAQPTMEVLKEYPVKLIEIPKSSFNHGLTRDRAAEAAAGEFLIFINQDAEPENQHWLDLMVEPFAADNAIAAVQGRIKEDFESPLFFWGSCGEGFYFTSEAMNWISKYHGIGFSTVNCAIRRSIWQQHPFGKMDIVEDKGFQKRVHINGWEIVYSEGSVFHTHDYNYSQLKRRCQDEGYGWRLMGEDYAFLACLKDILILKNYVKLVRGILSGRVKKTSEILFPLMRPVWVFKGNRYNTGLLSR